MTRSSLARTAAQRVSSGAHDARETERYARDFLSSWTGSVHPVEGPVPSEHPLQRVLAILSRRIRFLVALAVLGASVAAAYSAATQSYEASADILVTPMTGGDERYATLGLIRESADPTRDVETATRLVERYDVAAQAKKALGSSETPEGLLGRVAVDPVAQSNIVTITSRAESGREAAAIANGFANALIEVRTAEMRAQIDRVVRNLNATAQRLVASGEATGADELRRRAGDYEALRATNDPTLRVVSAARPSTSPSSPSPLMSAVVGALVATLLGVGGLLAWSALHPTLMTESEVRNLVGLPVLARTPPAPRRASSRLFDGPRLPLEPLLTMVADGRANRRGRAWDADPSAELLSSIETPTLRRARVVGFGALTAGTGTTTTVRELGMQLAIEGESVLLVQLDQNGSAASHGARSSNAPRPAGSPHTVPVSAGDVGIYPQWGGLHMLAPSGEQTAVSAESLARAVREARESYDIVLVDIPPFELAGEALRMAREVDTLVLVARMGRTDLEGFASLVELLKAAGVAPLGVVLTHATRGTLPPSAPASAEPARLDGAAGTRVLPHPGRGGG
jgi:capsular polysaccharide biosynthesis protein/Mrp family chromosome partitioning ATPase